MGDAVVFKSPHDPRVRAEVPHCYRGLPGSAEERAENTEVIRKGYCWAEGDDKDANGSDSRGYASCLLGC